MVVNVDFASGDFVKDGVILKATEVSRDMEGWRVSISSIILFKGNGATVIY